MTKDNTSTPAVPPRFFAQLLLPFAIPALLTLALVLTVGEGSPRNTAPGSGLKAAGFGAAMLTCLAVWLLATGGIADPRARKLAAIMCGMVGLMGWPVWSMGVLPSVNGMRLGPAETIRMTLERTEFTVAQRSSTRNHWAWLRPDTPDSRAAAGRYFIPEATYRQWNGEQPRSVTVTTAPGLLGAQVVTGYGLPADQTR
ncbi:hypothetical protein [Erythrobacter donghaensis]|uniref:hypothetical protein n=1 Tax=Erythrobacter donghaensis TaxID=267135 RepID=UPI000A362B50|nr:hypothetical protein [Erythrobacter donghaensis]